MSNSGDPGSDLSISSERGPETLDEAAEHQGESVATPPGLRTLLQQAIRSFIELNITVYLERFGFLIPTTETVTRLETVQSRLQSRQDTVRSIRFEKCALMSSLHRERFGRIVETKDLAHRIRLSSPPDTTAEERTFRQAIDSFFDELAQAVVRDGFSEALPEIGTFYALHNRQGTSPRDWFAGADILVSSSIAITLQQGEPKHLPRPVLDDPWEPFTALYGAPQSTFAIDIVRELRDLGYTIANDLEVQELHRRPLSVAVFLRDGEQKHLVFVTNGLARLAHDATTVANAAPLVGTELVLQLPCSAECGGEACLTVPEWPARPFALGWVLLMSAASRSVKVGMGLGSCEPLVGTGDSELKAVLINEFKPIRAEQLVATGAFRYMTLVGVTADEALLATQRSPQHLLSLLSHRGLDQVTKPARSSLLARTVIASGNRTE